jgi:hypothetical protein
MAINKTVVQNMKDVMRIHESILLLLFIKGLWVVLELSESVDM